MLGAEFEECRIEKFYYPMGCLTISHILYANDILVLTNDECRSLKQLLKIIGRYKLCSGQMVNPSKSTLLFSSKINGTHRRRLLRLIDFVESQFLFNYLGALIHLRWMTIRLFDHFI